MVEGQARQLCARRGAEARSSAAPQGLRHQPETPEAGVACAHRDTETGSSPPPVTPAPEPRRADGARGGAEGDCAAPAPVIASAAGQRNPKPSPQIPPRHGEGDHPQDGGGAGAAVVRSQRHRDSRASRPPRHPGPRAGVRLRPCIGSRRGRRGKAPQPQRPPHQRGGSEAWLASPSCARRGAEARSRASLPGHPGPRAGVRLRPRAGSRGGTEARRRKRRPAR